MSLKWVSGSVSDSFAIDINIIKNVIRDINIFLKYIDYRYVLSIYRTQHETSNTSNNFVRVVAWEFSLAAKDQVLTHRTFSDLALGREVHDHHHWCTDSQLPHLFQPTTNLPPQPSTGYLSNLVCREKTNC